MSQNPINTKVKDLDKLLNEYEFNFSNFKQKQQLLEKRIEILEKEFNILKQTPFKNKTNLNHITNNSSSSSITNQKLLAIEKSHRILESELKLLKETQLNDLENIKENIDQLQTQLFGDVILSTSVSEQSGLNEMQAVDLLQQQCAEIQDRLNNLRKRKQDNTDINNNNNNMQFNYNELKTEMRTQFNNLVEERRQFEMEKNLFSQDLEQTGGMLLNNTTMIISQESDHLLNNSSFIMHESILELEQKADEWEIKYKNELDSFNLLSQQQECQIKQLKEQLLTAKLNNEAKNLDLTNQLKLLNDDLFGGNNNNSNNKTSLIESSKENNEQIIKMSKYPSVHNFLDNNNESNKQMITSNDLMELKQSASFNRKLNLTESIMDLEGKLSEWGQKYNKEIDTFNHQQQQQIILNQKEEKQIKILKEQITAAKLVNESDDLNLIDNPKRNQIRDSILNLESKFNKLEQIYNTESVLLDNRLKSISSSNLVLSNSKQFIDLINNNNKVTTKFDLDEDILETANKSFISSTNNKLENDMMNKLIKSNSAETIFVLEAKVDEWEKKHQRELEIFNILSKQQEIQIKELKEKLSIEALQVESLNSEYSLLQAEASRLENALRIKCENLENELNETNKLNEYECELAMKNKKYNLAYENYDKEIKALVEQISHLQKGLKIKEEEFENLEKLIEIERLKTTKLMNQIDDLNCINIQLNMQNSEAKSRLVTLDLVSFSVFFQIKKCQYFYL
jgi:hypothetical protein